MKLLKNIFKKKEKRDREIRRKEEKKSKMDNSSI